MKTLVISTALLCMSFVGFSQETQTHTNSLLGNTNMFNHVEFTGIIFDLGYLNGPVMGKNLNGIAFNGLVAFNNHFATGLNVDYFATNTVVLSDKLAAVNPQFSFTTVSWRNEFLFGVNRKIGFSIPVDIGIGTASYEDDYYKTDKNTSRVIADDHFFSGATGVNMNINLFKHVALSLGGQYRITSGATKVGSDSNYSNYLVHASLRFRLFKDDFEDDQSKKQISH
jgi:hypothetical protein